jgi:tetratricopeptide (TPR) repeat protein
MDQLDREKHNLRAALAWCVENGEVDRGLQLGGAVWRYWYVTGSIIEERDWQQRLLRLFPGAERTSLLARALNGAGVLSIHLSDFSTAKVLYEQSLAIRRELDDHTGIAFSLNNLRDLALREGDSGLALQLLEHAVAESRVAGDRWREATTSTIWRARWPTGENTNLPSRGTERKRGHFPGARRQGESSLRDVQAGLRGALSRQLRSRLGTVSGKPEACA